MVYIAHLAKKSGGHIDKGIKKALPNDLGRVHIFKYEKIA